MKPVLTHYTDRNGKVGAIKDIEDSPMYDGHYHREWDKEIETMERIKSIKSNSMKRPESKWELILRSCLSRKGVELTNEQRNAVIEAMIAVAVTSVDTYRENEAKAINREAAGLIPSMINGELKHWIRNFYFKRAKRQAQMLSNNDNRWYYVIRKSDVAYEVFHTGQADHLKRVGILSKTSNAMKLTAAADFVARPETQEIKNVYRMQNLKYAEFLIGLKQRVDDATCKNCNYVITYDDQNALMDALGLSDYVARPIRK